MRLIFYGGGFAPIGGVQSFIHDLLIGLHERGVEMPLVCWGAQSELLGNLLHSGIEVKRTFWRWGCRWHLPDRLLLLKSRAELIDTDVVVFGHLQPIVQEEIMRLRAIRARPRAVLVTPYRPAEMWSEKPPHQNVLNSFDTIVVQGRSFAVDLEGFGYRGDVRILPYLPPVCRQALPVPSTSVLRIGYLGRLAAQKNLGYLLRCFALLRKNVNATLELYGDGQEKEELAMTAKRLGVNGAVTFHGPIPRRLVPATVASCHLFAFSSISEGQVLAALEILAGGRPIVATPVGVFPEMLSDSRLGIVAPLDNPAAYAEELYRLGEQVLVGGRTPDKIQQAYLERYSREAVLDAYVRLFEELVS